MNLTSGILAECIRDLILVAFEEFDTVEEISSKVSEKIIKILKMLEKSKML